MSSRVEGYFVEEGAVIGPRQGTNAEWLAGLRKEARRAMVRRLVLERVRNGGFQGAPKPVPLDSTADYVGYGSMDDGPAPIPAGTPAQAASGWRFSGPRVVETIVIGLTVAVLGTWLCGRSR